MRKSENSWPRLNSSELKATSMRLRRSCRRWRRSARGRRMQRSGEKSDLEVLLPSGAQLFLILIPHYLYSSSGRIQEFHAGVQLPAAEASGVRGVLRLPGSPRQRPSLGRPFWRETSPGIHPDPRETGPTKGTAELVSSQLV